MGRTEQRLRRLRDRLNGSEAEAMEPSAIAAELVEIAERSPKADEPLAPVLVRLAEWLESEAEPDALTGVRAVVDAGIEYGANRDHPARDSLLAAAVELVDALAARGDDAAPASAAADTELPPTFVGDLPPRSTLDDAALLLVQLEPGDSYGIASLIEILEQLTAETDQQRKREGLEEALRILASGPADAARLEAVGEILERVGEPAESEESLKAEAGESATDATPAEPSSGQPWRPGPDADLDLLREFVVESGDLLRSAEQALLELEADPDNTEAVNVVFRAFHTIKGTSGFLGIEPATEVCHHAESLFSRVRDGVVAFDAPVADVSLESVDMLTAVLEAVSVAVEGGEPAGVDVAGLARRLSAAGRGDDAPEPEPASDGAADEPDERPDPVPVAVQTKSGGLDRETTVRVRTDRLDRLVDMVGELVIAQSMIAQDDVVQDDRQHDLAKKVAHGGKIVRELQDLSMALRMVPLKSTFSKLQRLVRDLARKSGKQIRLFTDGEETEIDRTMVDVLGDPLVHMIRNAVDHGIEPASERAETGKEPAGTLWLRSYHAGGNVVVELEDDGRGMNRDRIVEKAVERGLIRSGDGLTDSEVFKLVFEPGFSTAASVTDVSGRGVGMDVVRRNIETLRGRIELDSSPGEGTRVTLRLPLTLAITEGMLMRVGPERYILPTLSIERNVRPEPEMLSTVSGRGEMLLLRDELLPILRLHDLFGVEGARQRIEDGLLVVVGAAERRCALLVDELLGQHQVVVKSLGDGLGKVTGVTGGAVLGDGTVGLILDAGELVTLARDGGTASQAA
jgi:two-component system chemotaxis sensor kinase CheA